MVAKLLAGMHIADMQLDQGHARAFDGVVQRHAGVRVGPGVEHHASQASCRVHAPGLVQGIDQLAFVVALAEIKRKAIGRAGALTQRLHVGQGLAAIDLRLARAQQVQVGAVQNHHGFHRRSG